MGLFPQSFTTPLHAGMGVNNTSASTPKQMQSVVEEEPDNAVMQATLTDVQEAIEQLGGHNDQDASRSFTFASSHGDISDRELETEDEEISPSQEWHRGARKLLAQNAQKEMEKRRSQEERPPVLYDMVSDESEPEEGDDYHHNTRRFSPVNHRVQSSIDTIPGGKLASQPVPEEPHDEDAAHDIVAPAPLKSPKPSGPGPRANSPLASKGYAPTPPDQLFPLPQSPTLVKESSDPSTTTLQSPTEVVKPTPKSATYSPVETSEDPEVPPPITPMRVPLPQSPAPAEPLARDTPPPIKILPNQVAGITIGSGMHLECNIFIF
jgi:hypothetical protein